jgi:gluconate kinase
MKKILAIMLVTTALTVAAHASPPVGPLADNLRDQWRRCGEPDHSYEWTKARIKSVIVNCSAIIKDRDRFLREMDNSPAARDSIALAYRTRAVALRKLRSLDKK